MTMMTHTWLHYSHTQPKKMSHCKDSKIHFSLSFNSVVPKAAHPPTHSCFIFFWRVTHILLDDTHKLKLLNLCISWDTHIQTNSFGPLLNEYEPYVCPCMHEWITCVHACVCVYVCMYTSLHTFQKPSWPMQTLVYTFGAVINSLHAKKKKKKKTSNIPREYTPIHAWTFFRKIFSPCTLEIQS